MAITGPASYLPTTDEFLAHWAAAQNDFGGAIRLRGDVSRTQLESLRETLASQITTLTDTLNAREFARGDINTGSRELIRRLEQFNARVRVLFEPGSKFVNALPKVPDPTRSPDKVLRPLDDGANVWMNVEAEGTPVVLSGGFDLAQFQAGLVALKAAYQGYNTAALEVKLARGARNETQEKIYPILKQYREIIPTYFDEGTAIGATLPRLTPKPGHTPEPVNASALWDASEAKARLAWDAAADGDLKQYQVRYTPGPDYDEDDAAVLANISPERPREWLTDAGLVQPGASSTFKVYVMLNTGNEAGSESLTVTRPAEPS